jgi:hypothetical protein
MMEGYDISTLSLCSTLILCDIISSQENHPIYFQSLKITRNALANY